jgi:hypothetical protein
MERALRVSPGYITKYEEQSPACSPMRALAPALPIPWAFPPSRGSPFTSARQILLPSLQIACLRAKS